MRLARRSISGGSQLQSEINVTPLVDVCLVLLIIFMIVTPLMVGQVQLNLPRAASADKVGEEHPLLTISVKADGTIFAGGAIVGAERAGEEIAAAAAKDNQRPVVLRVDRDARYGDAVKIVEYCRQAGFHEIGLAADRSAATAQ
ncbi:MAG: biopolymer transporter ExbD [Acidobacteria bacterium]|nr:biopolymer transporter ExbD [Acidobacteriota bacterium]